MPPKVQIQLGSRAVHQQLDTIAGVVVVSANNFLRVKTLDLVLQCVEYVSQEVEIAATNSRYTLGVGPGGYEPQFAKVFNFVCHLRLRLRLLPDQEDLLVREPSFRWSHCELEPDHTDYGYNSEGCIVPEGITTIPFELVIPEGEFPPSMAVNEGNYVRWELGADLRFLDPRISNIRDCKQIEVVPSPGFGAELQTSGTVDTQSMLTFDPQNSRSTWPKLFKRNSSEKEKLLVTIILQLPQNGIFLSSGLGGVSLALIREREGLELRIRRVEVLLMETVEILIYGKHRTKSVEHRTHMVFQHTKLNENAETALPRINEQLRVAKCTSCVPGTFSTKNLRCFYSLLAKVTISTINQSEKIEMAVSSPVYVYNSRII